MTAGPAIATARLRLRPFGADDAAALHALYGRPEVRRYLFDGQTPSRELVAELIARSEAGFARHGLG